MHQNTSGGRAPPGPAGELKRSPRLPIAAIRGKGPQEGKGGVREGVERGREGTMTGGEKKGEGRGEGRGERGEGDLGEGRTEGVHLLG